MQQGFQGSFFQVYTVENNVLGDFFNYGDFAKSSREVRLPWWDASSCFTCALYVNSTCKEPNMYITGKPFPSCYSGDQQGMAQCVARKTQVPSCDIEPLVLARATALNVRENHCACAWPLFPIKKVIVV